MNFDFLCFEVVKYLGSRHMCDCDFSYSIFVGNVGAEYTAMINSVYFCVEYFHPGLFHGRK